MAPRFDLVRTAAAARPIVRAPDDVSDELPKPLIRLVSPAIRYSIEEPLDVASVTIHRAGQFSSLRPLVGIFHRCGKGNTRTGRPTIVAAFEMQTESQEDPSGRHVAILMSCSMQDFADEVE